MMDVAHSSVHMYPGDIEYKWSANGQREGIFSLGQNMSTKMEVSTSTSCIFSNNHLVGVCKPKDLMVISAIIPRPNDLHLQIQAIPA